MCQCLTMSRPKPSTTTEALYNSQVPVASVPNRFFLKKIQHLGLLSALTQMCMIWSSLSFTLSRFGPGVLVLLKKDFTLDHVQVPWSSESFEAAMPQLSSHPANIIIQVPSFPFKVSHIYRDRNPIRLSWLNSVLYDCRIVPVARKSDHKCSTHPCHSIRVCYYMS